MIASFAFVFSRIADNSLSSKNDLRSFSASLMCCCSCCLSFFISISVSALSVGTLKEKSSRFF